MPYVLSAHVHRALWDQIGREREGERGEEKGRGRDGGKERGCEREGREIVVVFPNNSASRLEAKSNTYY
jgi:hypothetical protein